MIVPATIIASKTVKTYNPFAEIFERLTLHAYGKKLEELGYSLIPLGYSADLMMKKDGYFLNFLQPRNLAEPASDTKVKQAEEAKIRNGKKVL